MLNNAGPRSTNLKQNTVIKLKAVYTLVEQLYTGTQRSLAVISHNKQPPALIQDVLDKLSVMPKIIEEIK